MSGIIALLLMGSLAGFGSQGTMEDTSLEDAKYKFEVNLFGVARLTNAVLPYMRAKQPGYIVNISSMDGRISTPLGSWYHAAKYALESRSDCLQLELAKPLIFIRTWFGDRVFDRAVVSLM